MIKNWRRTCVSAESTIFNVMQVMDAAALQIALVVDEQLKLLGVVTDGDVRRGLLRGIQLNLPVSMVMNANPSVASTNDSPAEIQKILVQKNLHQIPLVDEKGCVTDLFVIDDLLENSSKALVFLMAGGEGMRLRPLTQHVPKPMLLLNGKPILYWIIQEFKSQGFFEFVISVRYLGQQIRDYFKDGSDFGVKIDYVQEETPLGTAGALSLLRDTSRAVIVMNGDLLTKAPFASLLKFHKSQKVQTTMCVRQTSYQIPYGVVGLHEGQILNIDEKPVQSFFVNAGIYVLEASVLALMASDKHLDMTQLFDQLMQKNWPTMAYPLHEFWMDIGYPADYEKAQSEVRQWFHE